jgi:dihydrolipoamide dehydrogenase
MPVSPATLHVAVIGGGPGGYAAAFKAADLGLRVTLIDKDENPGGVCLYRGCIPSKALLHVAKLIFEAKESANWGVKFSTPEINLTQLQQWKGKVVGKLTGGLGQLCKARGIQYFQGDAAFRNGTTLDIRTIDGKQEALTPDFSILATGSSPAEVSGLSLNSPRVMDSTSALEVSDIPKKLLVIGGGYIGLELGTVYRALGSQVTVVEMTSGLLMTFKSN